MGVKVKIILLEIFKILIDKRIYPDSSCVGPMVVQWSLIFNGNVFLTFSVFHQDILKDTKWRSDPKSRAPLHTFCESIFMKVKYE